MKTDITDPQGARFWLKRIGWLVLIWAGSVAALGLLAYLMRKLMWWAGLK
jgi:hypothetical protein